MNPIRRRRLILVLVMVLGVGTAVGFALYAFNQNLMFYFSPSEVAAGKAPPGARFRLGGIVLDGSVQRAAGSLQVRFVVGDGAQNIPVVYEGILPDLFREGQVVLVMGRLGSQGEFAADEVLAKHDENYMPREVAESLRQAANQAKDN